MTGLGEAPIAAVAATNGHVVLDALPPEVRVAFDGRRLDLPAPVAAIVERGWAAARRANPALKRGLVLSVSGVERAPRRLVLRTALTDYAHFVATRDGLLDAEHACRPLHVAALVRTADDRLLVGEMAPHTAWPGRLTLVAGGIDVAHVGDDRTVEVERSLHAELLEELGIEAGDDARVAAIEPRYFKHGGPRGFVGLIWLVTLRVDAAAAIATYRRRTGDRPELSQVLALPARSDAIERFLAADSRPRIDYLDRVLRAEVA